jgi:hypothetical protein
VIDFGDKERYLECLKASNDKDLSPMCTFLGELLHESLDKLVAASPPAAEAVVGVSSKGTVKSASERLAHAVRGKVASLHLQREARYNAWVAAFNAFREAFGAAVTDFNQLYSTTPFSIRYLPYDTLPIDKYEALITGNRTTKTWLHGCEIIAVPRREKFVFFFQGISSQFVATARSKGVALSPNDVSLAVSRWSDGLYRRLQDEPVFLREIAYSDGQLLYLHATGSRSWEVQFLPLSEVINTFFADAVEAFF